MKSTILAVQCSLVLAVMLCSSSGTPVLSGESRGSAGKVTWFETFLATRESLVGQRESSATPRLESYTSEILRGGQSARHVSVALTDQDELYLYVTGAPEVIYGAATWADAKLIDAEGNETFACHIPGLEVLAGRHDIDCNLKSGVSGPLRIAGQQYEHGIHVYAASKIRIPLARRYVRFESSIGIDDWVAPHGAVRFHVTDRGGAARLDLWTRLELEFSDGNSRREMKAEREDRMLQADWEPGDFAELAQRYAHAPFRIRALQALAIDQATSVRDFEALQQIRHLYHRSRALAACLDRARVLKLGQLRLATEDLAASFGAAYPAGRQFLERLDALEASLTSLQQSAKADDLVSAERVESLVAEFDNLQREALLANPLLDFDKLLLMRRVPHGDPRRPHGTGYGVGEYIGLPRQSSKCNPNIDEPFGWDNEIAVLSPVSQQGSLTTLYQPSGRRLITDIDLHWDADRLLFSMPGAHDKWHVFEMRVDGNGLRQLTPSDQPDVHYYDSCYLPDGDIAFVSTAPLQGVPCNAGVIVGMMYMMDGDGSHIRQVCFEQDHSYCPTVLNDGRILYLRWDYTDTPHVWNRILFSMFPDGTGQSEYYGSNSYWPNAIFYARPIPKHPTKVVGIVTGHHVGRVGELVVFDPALGRHETDGVVQRIPGYGERVAPLIEDKLTEHSWPKFAHPYPLSEKHFIVSCKPTPDSLWGVYLVDVFDNMVLLKEEEGHVLLEPIPLRKSSKPPQIVSRVDPQRDDALVYITDIYQGPGLANVPRGSVKQLRVFTYHFGYQKLAGIEHRIGSDGPWEVKQVLGTVPVASDGSAFFRIPAKTPISIQPLDAQGQALQLMRSWMTAMPGETLSCTGCHENHNASAAPTSSLALRRGPSKIKAWYGPARGFSFKREVQPVLDKYCVACHDGSPRDDGAVIPNLSGDQKSLLVYRYGDPELLLVKDQKVEELKAKYRGIFEPSYIALRRLVRVGGLESDLHLLPPKEFHADTSELVQMLRKGHHGVQLDEEAWDRLITWIDLNAPCHGTWSEFTSISGDQRQRRCELQKLYDGIALDKEAVASVDSQPIVPVVPQVTQRPPEEPPQCDGWPFQAGEAFRRQSAEGPARRSIDLGGGVTMDCVKIPAGRFVMGDNAGNPDESPAHAVTIARDFWIGQCEVTNQQYAQFFPEHDSRFEHRTSWIFSEEYLGWPLNGPQQPVVRVSWDEASAFCRELSRRIGANVKLPTEAQWEYACRAGADSAFSFGELTADFAPYGNLADRSMRQLAYEGWRPLAPDVVARDDRFDDGCLVTSSVASYAPNQWGLFDMHGNIWEWTRSRYEPYPYQEDDGRNDLEAVAARVVRGGSWHDRPSRCRSAFRLSYPSWQKVYNVGFRVVIEEPFGEALSAHVKPAGSSLP